MKENRKMRIAIAVAVTVAIALVLVIVGSAGGMLDVVARQSVTSFGNMLAALPQAAQTDAATGAWALTAPDGTARFLWAKDLSVDTPYAGALEWDAKPVVDAGLDVAKLPAAYAYLNGQLTVAVAPGSWGNAPSDAATPQQSYRQLVEADPSALNYHMSLDHFGIKLGDGNLFEWARDLAVNTVTGASQDKDLVFVLNPEPLIAAGVNPAEVDGWLYAQVEVMQNNTTTLVYKLLKPFNIG